jgi:iron complex transport system ATP-binding protein
LSVLYSLADAGMRYHGAPVLDAVTLSFASGQLVAIIGPNGAGKSTLLGIMAGLRPGHTGRCEYRGVEPTRWPRRAFARKVAFIPQNRWC